MTFVANEVRFPAQFSALDNGQFLMLNYAPLPTACHICSKYANNRNSRYELLQITTQLFSTIMQQPSAAFRG